MKIQHTSALRAYSAALALFLAWAGLAGAQLPVTNGLRLWLAANTGVVTSGSSVTSWTDLSGNGNGVSQGTAINQPTFVTNGMHGLPVVRFDGGTDFMQGTAISNMISNNAYTTFAVFKVNAFIRNTFSYSTDAVFADSNGYMGLHLQSGGPSILIYNWDVGDDTATIGANTNQTMLVTAMHAGGNLSISRLGGSSASTPSGDTQVTTGNLMLSSGFSGADNRFNGDIAELLIYKTALTANQRGDIQEYLYTKWVIPEPTTAVLALLGFAVARVRAFRIRFRQ